jgi:phenylalanyl-tRNA synthetase beta chain
MHTDASHRFERGADWAATTLACERVAELILQSADGELCAAQTDAIGRKLARKPLKLRRSEILRILGQDISDKDVKRILGRLGFGLHGSAGVWQVTLPTWRLDVEREIDLIEEIARLHGYNNFKNALPAFKSAVVELPHERQQDAVRGRLLALGYDEAISTTFIPHAEAEQFARGTKAVELANPLSEEAAVMRTSLVPGMLGMLAHNVNRGTTSVQLFETGNIFELAGSKTGERIQLCLGATGNAMEASAHEPARAYSFFDLKGAVEEVLSAFERNSIYFDADAQAPHYHPARSARVALDGRTVGRLGQLSAEMAAARKLKQEIFVAEIFLDRLYEHSPRQPRYEPLSKYPAVERDFSFIFLSDVTFEQVRGAMEELGIAELRSVTPADLLHGKAAERTGVPAGKYSMLLRASFQSHERTLRDDEVAEWAKQIIAALEKLGGALRA